MAEKKYTIKAGKSKNAGYTKLAGGGIKSKKTGKVYHGKEASMEARKRRVKFEWMNKAKKAK